MNESAQPELGVLHFLSQIDAMGMVVLLLLLLLSLASWYLILLKATAVIGERKRAEAFLKEFWEADSLASIGAKLTAPDNAFAALAAAAQAASERQQQGLHKLADAGGFAEYLTRVLRNGIDQESARVEHGLTLLASAGSAAPFIGLFGTVWGIYHALLTIGATGQGTLDKVAGPVGEALIMTALGLAVAIPAVLAYNAFTRRNRLWLAELDGFAHDLYALMTVGPKSDRSGER